MSSTSERAKFLGAFSRPQAGATALAGLGSAAVSYNGGLSVWRSGITLELDGSYVSVYPVRGISLARAALKRALG